MAAQTRQPLSPAGKDPASVQQQPQESAPVRPLTDLEVLTDATSFTEADPDPNTKPPPDYGAKSASSSPPATPSEPPSLDLATPTPSQTASPTRDGGQYEKYLMNYETEKNVYTPVNDAVNDTLNTLLPTNNTCIDAANRKQPDLQRTSSIIQTQFDLEILLKHRELRGIDDEIAKIHVMMLRIKRACENPKLAVASHEPPEFAEFYAQYLDPKKSFSQRCRGTPEVSGNDHYLSVANTRSRQNSFHVNNPSLYPPKILRSSSFSAANHFDAPSKPQTRQQLLQLSQNNPPHKPSCVMRRNDGVLVKLACPKCLRENFGSAQGFINHCRISHALEFTTHDAAAIACGIEVAEQDKIGLEARQRNSEQAIPVPEPVHAKRTAVNALHSDQAASMTVVSDVTAVPATRQNLPYIACGSEAIRTENLTLLVKKRRQGQGIDVQALAKTSMQKFPKGHLLDDEEEEDESLEELGEEATPFERALVEAKKLKLDIDEIRRTAPVPSTVTGSTTKPGRKKRGGARGRRGSSRVSSVGAAMQRSQAASAPAIPASAPVTRSVSAESARPTPSPAAALSATVGGKYRPGFAPSHWNHLGKNESIPGKTIPGHVESARAPVIKSQISNSAVLAKTRGKVKKVERPTVSISRSNTRKTSNSSFDDDDDDDDEITNDDDSEGEDDDDDNEDEDGDTIMKNSQKSVNHNRSRPRSTGKTLPGARTSSFSSSAPPVDSLQKFIPLSRFF